MERGFVRLGGPLRPGRFVRRENRFRAVVDVDGRHVAAHVPNPGRMHELFTPGRRVYVARRRGAHRVTAFDMLLAEVPGGLVSVDTRLPVRLVARALASGGLPAFESSLSWRGEVAFGASRFDFALEEEAGRRYVEVKSASLVVDGVALFPDAPTTRGQRHVRELAAYARDCGRATVLFVIQRGDAEALRPNAATDPGFADALAEASASGVDIIAYRCAVERHQVSLTDQVPVELI